MTTAVMAETSSAMGFSCRSDRISMYYTIADLLGRVRAQTRVLSVREFACSRYAAENLLDAVHLRPGQGSGRARPGHGPCDAVVRGVQRAGPPGHHVL